MTFRVPSACSCRRARPQPPGSPRRPKIVAPAGPGRPRLPVRARTGRMDGDPGPTNEGDDVTGPGTSTDVPDADRAEQEALLDPPAAATAGDASNPGPD